MASAYGIIKNHGGFITVTSEIGHGTTFNISSGYALNGQATEIMNKGCNGFIQKPFNLSELSQKIRSVLDTDPEADNS